MAAVEMNISIDSESTSDEMVLNIGDITFETSGKEMQSGSRLQQNTTLLRAVCALMNSRGGKVKAHIKNKDYNYTKHGIPKNLDESLKAIQPLVQNNLDCHQKGHYFFFSVKSCSLDMSGVQPATIATNLYMRNGASSISKGLRDVLQFFKVIENYGKRSPLKTSLLDKKPGEYVKDEADVQEQAASLFEKTTLTEMSEFNFTESKNVEYKSFETHKCIQRVKEILPRTVSAFGNTEGGYLFIGLSEKTHQIIGFEAGESHREELTREIEKCIQQLPVVHFCEEKQQIKYTCKFIPVLRSGAVCSYVCALRVERFCCAVFAAEPDSWHVEDGCVKRFTSEQWVKVLMSSRPGP